MLGRPVLQLTIDYEAVRIITAKEALKKVTKGKAVVEVPTHRLVYPGVFLPSVIRLIVRPKKHVPIRMQVVTRKNIFLRDRHQCQYCGRPKVDLELEHVIPRCQGGKSTWENLVAACRTCNGKKAGRTPEEAGMKLIRRPLPSTVHTPRFLLRQLGSDVPEWRKFLYHDSAGDERFVVRQ